ncbi:hypothetical protein OMAG_002224 [Candidatus Omnitrophus magneticus]|uniref:Uncharacterized protein n=1 Tax=Candidatus Omnitrophus magneticus TaxID=1609969 RepID=A0A0F0CKR6_9BACT|nr:hypothetical protein OMAG_002224 [Candidatus Omnitrophus magneticus]
MFFSTDSNLANVKPLTTNNRQISYFTVDLNVHTLSNVTVKDLKKNRMGTAPYTCVLAKLLNYIRHGSLQSATVF